MLVEKPAPEGALRDLVPNRPEAAPRGLHRPEAVPRGLGVDAVALILALPLAQPRAQAPQGAYVRSLHLLGFFVFRALRAGRALTFAMVVGSIFSDPPSDHDVLRQNLLALLRHILLAMVAIHCLHVNNAWSDSLSCKAYCRCTRIPSWAFPRQRKHIWLQTCKLHIYVVHVCILNTCKLVVWSQHVRPVHVI